MKMSYEKFGMQRLRQRLTGHPEVLKAWQDSGEIVTDELLWRWLRSKDSLEEAETCLLAHAEWRISLGRITEVVHSIHSSTASKRQFAEHKACTCSAPGLKVLPVIIYHNLRQ